MRIHVAPLLLLFLAACSSGSSGVGEPVDLAGIWYLRDSSNLELNGRSNICVMANRPVLFTYAGPEAIWSAQEQEGGTITCEDNGVPGDTVPMLGPYMLYISEVAGSAVGDSVRFWAVQPDAITFIGTVRTAGMMAGLRPSTSFDGRVGTWVMRRHPF